MRTVSSSMTSGSGGCEVGLSISGRCGSTTIFFQQIFSVYVALTNIPEGGLL